MKGGHFEGEWRVVWPGGSIHWILGRASVLRAGEPERLIGINIDVTERKHAERASKFAGGHRGFLRRFSQFTASFSFRDNA